MQRSPTGDEMKDTKVKVADWGTTETEEVENPEIKNDIQQIGFHAEAGVRNSSRTTWQSVKRVGKQMKKGVGNAARFIRQKTRRSGQQNTVKSINLQQDSEDNDDEIVTESMGRSRSASFVSDRTGASSAEAMPEDDGIPVIHDLGDVEEIQS